MPLDLITTIPIGLIAAYVAKQVYTMISAWILQPKIIVEEGIIQLVNRTIQLRNQATAVMLPILAGALEVLNNAKEIVLQVLNTALQEVLRIVHLIVHIVMQGVMLVKQAYQLIMGAIETFYLFLKTINDGLWFVVNGVSTTVDTVVSLPGRLVCLVNTTVTDFMETKVIPGINWFLYGPKVSSSRYYMMLLAMLLVCAIWNYYTVTKAKKARRSSEQPKEKAA